MKLKQNSFESFSRVLKLFWFSFISLCRQFDVRQEGPAKTRGNEDFSGVNSLVGVQIELASV